MSVDFNKLVVDFNIKYWRYARRLMYTYNWLSMSLTLLKYLFLKICLL